MNSSLSKVTILLYAIILTLAISNCESVVNEKSLTSDQSHSAISQTKTNNGYLEKSQTPNYDQRLSRLAKNIPGLGGLFINDSGQLSVYLTNPGEQQAKAEAVFLSFKPLTKALARLRDQKPQYQATSISNMEILKGQYTFTTLYEWKKEVSSKILVMDGVYSSDIVGPFYNWIYYGLPLYSTRGRWS